MMGFILKCLLFFTGFLILDKALILIRNTAPDREFDKRLELILNGKIDSELLVFGSSRGARDIIASEIADSLHTTAYNLSYPGSSIQFHEYLLQKLVQFKNKIPKLIVLAVDNPSELESNQLVKFRFDRLYPLVKYRDVRNTLIEKGDKNKILSQLFIVHQLSIGSFDLRKKYFDEQDTILKDGSMPISYQGQKFNRIYYNKYHVYNTSKENELKINSFRNFMKICQDNNIKLLMASAPNFGTPAAGFFERMKKYAGEKKHSVMMYDTTKALYKDADFFFDAAHLKKNGATVFTSEVSDFIKKKQLLK